MSEIDRDTMRRLLREVRSVAQHASLTGSLRGGARVLVCVHNRCVSELAAKGDEVVGELFPPLDPGNTSIDEVGAASALLYGYIGGSGDESGGTHANRAFFGIGEDGE